MPVSTLEPGLRLGKYEVLGHIASGGMGAIYKAVDHELRRMVALKVLPKHLASNTRALERFHREARNAARLSNPHIVTIYECGYDADRDVHYLALEYIDGFDLLSYIARKGKLGPEEARRVLIQAAKALDHAFTQGVVHRDIKPANFLLARVRGKAILKLTDLGLALGEDDDEFKVTREGTTVGTVDYLSPEQARDSRAADIRSDIYSLGCTAYHMLAGKAPFAEGGLGERIYKHLYVEPPDVRRVNPAVSAGFWGILQKMLAKKPEDRYATPGELLADLKRTPCDAARASARQTVLETSSETPTEYDTTAPPIPARPAQDQTWSSLPVGQPHMRQPTSAPPAQETMVQPLVTLDQAKAAASFHERAVQVLNEGGGIDYARELLDSCLKLDPFNPAYLKTLRELNRKSAAGTFSRWFGSINLLAIKSKMRLARSVGDWRGLLEQGEHVLARQPADVDTHLDMADAALQLDLPYLALWLLEQGCEQAPDGVELLRELAHLYEDQKEIKKAIALWEKVHNRAPDDYEATRKLNDLSVQEHLAGGSLRR